MKHIDTTATAISKIKTQAKKIKLDQEIPLSQAQDMAANQAGYDNFHHAKTCESNTQKNKPANLLGTLRLRLCELDGMVQFEHDNEYALDSVTDELDEVVAAVGGGFGDMTTISNSGLKIIVATCKSLLKREPAFLDGYAHWVGALVALNKCSEAVLVGKPVIEAAFMLLQEAKEFEVNYYLLANRPFYRLAHNLVLAYYGANNNAEAKKLARKMLRLWPNDNTGFRFLLVPPDAD